MISPPSNNPRAGFQNACVRDLESHSRVQSCVWVYDCAAFRAEGAQGMQRHPRLQQVLAVLLRLWDAFELPPNPLDHLTELLGGPDQVRKQSPQLSALWPCLLRLDCGRILIAHQPSPTI